MAKREGIDPVTLELIKNTLSSIIDEEALCMVRTSYSHMIRDIMDMSTGLCDAEGNILAEGLVSPAHAGVMPPIIRKIREIWRERIYPGDVFMCNDAYEGASHCADLYTIKPVFLDGEIVAFTGSIAHELDMGGRTPGSNACDNTEIYQDGLRIPPLKYYERGERNYTLYRLLQKNVRISHKVIGDIEAQVAAISNGEMRFLEMVEKYGGWQTVRRYLDELLDYSERLTRAAIRELPDGEYEFEDFMDDDGFSPEPVRIRVKLIIEGDIITFDFTGSSPQRKSSINDPLSTTVALCNGALKCLLGPHIPSNSGVSRAINVIAPEGTIVNVSFPGACAGRGATMSRIFDTLQGAMAKIAPDRVPACVVSHDIGVCLGGKDTKGEPFVFSDFSMGSWGGSPWADGFDACCSLETNMANVPCESIEAEYPIRIEQYTFVPDTGGPGKYRGGLALIRDYRILSDDVICQWRQDRSRFAPWGLQGGKPGAFSEAYQISEGKERSIKKEIFFCKNGDLLRSILAGGGGWDPPWERDVEKVLDDVRNEKVSIERARRDYGVVIDEKTMQVDNEETRKLRANKEVC